jgi:serine/threonine protein kinase
LHSLRIAHLDLKPENVLVNDSGCAQLIDFGFAMFSFRPISGHICGSVGYIAPEIFRQPEFDGLAADIFSLGICLYSLFTGRVPFDDTRVFRQSRVNYRGIDADVCGLIASMIAADPSARPTVGQVRRHCIFSELNGRPSGSQERVIESSMADFRWIVVGKLANTVEMELSSLRARLVAVGANREKVLSALALTSA